MTPHPPDHLDRRTDLLTAPPDLPSGGAVRIFLHDFAGRGSHLELSRELGRRGHPVTFAYCGDATSGGRRPERRPGDPDSLRVLDCATARFENHDPAALMTSELAYGRSLGAAVRADRPDVVVSAGTPPAAQALLWHAARQAGARRVYWLQDVLDEGGRADATAEVALETGLLRGSDAVITGTGDVHGSLDARAVDAPRAVIESWASLEPPVGDKRNPWSLRHGLAERPVALYRGTLDPGDDTEYLLRAAELVGDTAEIVVVTAGWGRSRLETARRKQRLTHLRVLGDVPDDVVPDVLGAADVVVVLPEPGAGRLGVPAALLSGLAAGRAVVAAASDGSPAARLVRRADAGVVVPPGDHRGFARALRGLLTDPELAAGMGKAGRRHAEDRFDVARIADDVLALVARAGAREPA